MDERVLVARLSVLSNSFLVVLKVSVGLMIGSVSVLSEGIHSGMDLIASLIAFFSVRAASKPADEEHQFGHGKYENVAGTIEGVLILVAALWITWESIEKLIHGGAVGSTGWGIAVMAISATLNWFVSARLMDVAKRYESIALEADALHLRTDVYTSIGVLIGLIAMKFTGWWFVDPIVALGVALLITKAAWDLIKHSFGPLLDHSLPQEEEEDIRQVLEGEAKHFVEFHKLRTRKSGSERYVDMHIVVCRDWSIGQAHDLASTIRKKILKEYPSADVLVHQEPCSGRCREMEDRRCPKKIGPGNLVEEKGNGGSSESSL